MYQECRCGLTRDYSRTVEQEFEVTGNFDVYVGSQLVHSKKQKKQGRCESAAEVERVVMAVEEAIRAKTAAARKSAAAAAESGGSTAASTSSSS